MIWREEQRAIGELMRVGSDPPRCLSPSSSASSPPAASSSGPAGHDIRLHRSGTKHFHHPVVGRLDLDFDALELPAEPGLTLTACTAEAGSPSADALALLASWTADEAAAADR